MGKISANDLRGRLDPLLHGLIHEDSYDVKEINAKDLLTYNRFDLAAKLLLLDGVDVGGGTFSDLYSDHIRAFTLGSFIEPGNEDKRGIEKFIHSFLTLFDDMRSNGFSSDISIVPLARDGSILDGAHRVSCAVALGQKIKCVQFDTSPALYDFAFFWRRALPENCLDMCARKFIELSDNTFIALVWPSASGEDKRLGDIIQRVVYQKNIKLNANGFHNLLSLVYQGESWLGDRRANYPGAASKLAHCYVPDQPLRLLAFQANSLGEVQVIKQRVRDLFGLEKHSIHINDNKSEAIAIANALLNDNAIHFMNYARPNKYPSAADEIARFKLWCEKKCVSLDNVVLDGGLVLSVYGYRKNSDIDYLSCCEIKDFGMADGINSHNELVNVHGESVESLVYDDRFNFVFDGVKFVSFKQLLRMKSGRGENKDNADVLLMRSMVEGSSIKSFLVRACQWAWYVRINFYVRLLEWLRLVGLYEVVRTIYHKFLK